MRSRPPSSGLKNRASMSSRWKSVSLPAKNLATNDNRLESFRRLCFCFAEIIQPLTLLKCLGLESVFDSHESSHRTGPIPNAAVSRTAGGLLPPNPVRFLDAFVASLDIHTLGFTKARCADTGRPPYQFIFRVTTGRVAVL